MVSGGAALDFSVQQFFDDIGVPVIEGYGLMLQRPVQSALRHADLEL